LAIEGLQLPDEFEKPLQRSTSVRVGLAVARIGRGFRLFERDKRREEVFALPAGVRGGGVVRYAIDPGSQGAARIETFEAAPQGEVNFLEQVSPMLRIRFVSACEPIERGMERGGGLTVKIRLTLPHIQGSLRLLDFLTERVEILFVAEGDQGIDFRRAKRRR